MSGLICVYCKYVYQHFNNKIHLICKRNVMETKTPEKKVRKMLLEKKTLEKVIYFFLTRSLINFVLDGVKKLGFFVGS